MRKLVVGIVAAALLAPAGAQAKPGNLIASDTDSSDSFVSVNVYDFSIEYPKAVTYRLTLDPQAPGVVDGEVTCYRGKRRVSRDFAVPTSASLTKKAPLTLRKPESCYVDVSFEYDDYEQAGTLKLELFAKYRKRH